MVPTSRKFEIALFIIVLAMLAFVWALNGYDDTWLYIMAAIIAIPISWYSLGKKNKGE